MVEMGGNIGLQPGQHGERRLQNNVCISGTKAVQKLRLGSLKLEHDSPHYIYVRIYAHMVHLRRSLTHIFLTRSAATWNMRWGLEDMGIGHGRVVAIQFILRSKVQQSG